LILAVDTKVTADGVKELVKRSDPGFHNHMLLGLSDAVRKQLDEKELKKTIPELNLAGRPLPHPLD
jgi:hypothetical protein